MINVHLNYENLPNSSVVPTYVELKPANVAGTASASMAKRNLDIVAPTTFATNVFIPILKTLAADEAQRRPYVYSSFNANVKTESGKPEKCSIVYVRKSKFYESAFNMFSNFGINLQGLWLMHCQDTNTLYVPPKVYKFAVKLDAQTQAEYVMQLMYYFRFFNALTKVANEWAFCRADSEPTFSITENALKGLIEAIQPKSQDEDVKLEALSEDLTFDALVYVETERSSSMPLSMSVPKFPASALCYNVLEAEGESYLTIVNKTFKPAAYYVISPKRRCVYTNMELQSWNCMSDGSEFIPYLVGLCMDAFMANDAAKAFAVAHLELSTLLDSALRAKEFSISQDPAPFEEVLDRLGFQENYDAELYNDAHSDSIKQTSVSLSGSFASEYEGDAYAQKLYEQNQDYYDTFNLGKLTSLVRGIVSKGQDQVYSMLFEGETGTGKSTAARVMFYKAGLPWISINCSTNIDEADIFGSMIPNPAKKSADDPEFVWQDGPATRAVRNGYGLIVEEGNGARPGVLLKFNSLLDESRQIELSSGEVVKAHPNFRLAFTSNIAYQGTNELNKAFVDRFDVIHKFEDLDKQAVIETIKKRTGYQDVTKIEKVYGVYENIKKYSAENNLGLAISIRRLLSLFTKGKYYKTARDAVDDMLLDHAFLHEPEHLEFYKTSCLPAFDLNFKI